MNDGLYISRQQSLINKLERDLKDEKKRRQEVEGENTIIKGIGNSSPEMKKLQAENQELKIRIKQLNEVDQEHKKLVGDAYKDNKLLADDVAKKNNEIEQLKKQLNNPLNKMREVGIL